MKLKLTNIMLNGKLFEAGNTLEMSVPRINHQTEMIEWLQEYDSTLVNVSYEDALKVYIRTLIFYGETPITYEINVVHDPLNRIKAAKPNQPYNVDLLDETYTDYKPAVVDIKLPAELIIDESNHIFDSLDESLDQFIFEALVTSLPIEFIKIRH